MPGEVDAAVDQGGSEDRVGLAPGPAVEEAGENNEARKNKETPVPAPTDRIADAVHTAEKHERCQRDIDAEKHGKDIRKAAAGEWPKPVRRGKFHGHPDACQCEEVLPAAGRPEPCGYSKCERYENEASHGCGTRERESICPQGINQVDKKHRDAEQVAAAGAKVRGEHVFNATRGKKQHHQEEECESRERGCEGPAAIA